MKCDGKFIVTGKLLGQILAPGQTFNLGLKYSSPTLSVCQADGTDLADSDGNRGYVCVAKSTYGQSEVLVVTSNSTLTDGVSSDTDGVSFGIVLTRDWDYGMPMFLYAINDSGTCI